MRKLTLASGALLACVAPQAAQAAIIVNTGTIAAVGAGNNFQGQLASLGLTRYTTSGAELLLDAAATITFEFLGSESGFSDTFTALGTSVLSYTENALFSDAFAAPILIGSAGFNAGSLVDLLRFSSTGPGATATVGQDAFAIYLGGNQAGGPVNTLYLGFDDQLTGPDDDYDDFLVRATITSSAPVPEPATWAMAILGLTLVGGAMRRTKRQDEQRIRF